MTNHIIFRTSSDTLKLQRLIDYLKTTGSDAGTKLEANASEYLNRVNVSVILINEIVANLFFKMVQVVYHSGS